MAPTVEARVVGLRRAHPAWGPSRIVWQLECDGTEPLPGRSSVYRALVRHGLVEGKKRKRRREDYRRWERGRAMELWQMDVMGRMFLASGLEGKVVTGIDDHSRFIVSAKAVLRATARPVCQALGEALARHGVPSQILTDNGKVFTARFGRGPGLVMFDRICIDNGIKHLLTAPYSPTTTGRSSGCTRQCGWNSSPRRTGCSPPSPSCRRLWTPGSWSTTPPGHTNLVAGGRRSNGSAWRASPWPPAQPRLPGRCQHPPLARPLASARPGCRGG